MTAPSDVEVEAFALAWASLDGNEAAFLACKADPAREATEGRYHGDREDARELLCRARAILAREGERRKPSASSALTFAPS